MSARLAVPAALVSSYSKDHPEWLTDLPDLAARVLDRWGLAPDGAPANGVAGLVLPVLRGDGTRAVVKLQPPTAESAGIPAGLRAWDGDGVVRLLDHDPIDHAQLLERLHPTPLSTMPDDREATRILGGLLARLVRVPAPGGIRRLADVAADMLAAAPGAVTQLPDPDDRAFVLACAAAVAEVIGEPGDRLLHWDLHYDNILAADREPWLAIDPEPLAGDPGFDLLPALVNRWDDIVASGDVARAVRWRFDLLTEHVAVDRRRAVAWTLGRVLQNALWDIDDGKTVVDPGQVAIARAIQSATSAQSVT